LSARSGPRRSPPCYCVDRDLLADLHQLVCGLVHEAFMLTDDRFSEGN
jgi:hypothetical protein